jgi:PPK2 family polyphosphate:nucleotide phosphotransferase
VIFQAIDAAGKDSTIRAVTTGVNPAGFQVYSFKQPSTEELDHDFLWRTSKCLPEKGRIGIFNRSYYEETLVLRVHPEYLAGQRIDIPEQEDKLWLWQERFHSIREHELHLARNNTVIIKFWLNLSKDTQKQRFIARIDDPSKNWKFSAGDLKERALWDEYMQAYKDTVINTSKDYAPWYVIPADNKPYMRWQVAKIIRQTLENINPAFPEISEKEKSELEQHKNNLLNEI